MAIYDIEFEGYRMKMQMDEKGNSKKVDPKPEPGTGTLDITLGQVPTKAEDIQKAFDDGRLKVGSVVGNNAHVDWIAPRQGGGEGVKTAAGKIVGTDLPPKIKVTKVMERRLRPR